MVLWPLGLMGSVPLFEPVYSYFSARLSRGALVAMDLVHFSSSFAVTGLLVAWWLRWLGRRLGADAAGEEPA